MYSASARRGRAAATAVVLAALLRPAAADVVVVTREEARSIPPGAVVVHLTGPIDRAAADGMDAAFDRIGTRFRTVILRLDSGGGFRSATTRIVDRLDRFRATGRRLRTMVHQGDLCASACLIVFLAGDDREAGNASVWGIHGACRPGSNVPSAAATDDFVRDLAARGVARSFLDRLREVGCLTTPGVCWFSGYELVEVHKAGIIQHLLPAWQPEYPRGLHPAPGLAPR